MATNRDDNTPLPKIERRVLNKDVGPLLDRRVSNINKINSALSVQVSGDHYKTAKIQPIEFIHANNIPFCEANVIKYIFRWKSKNGVKDLEKAKHYIDLLIELESKNV